MVGSTPPALTLWRCEVFGVSRRNACQHYHVVGYRVLRGVENCARNLRTLLGQVGRGATILPRGLWSAETTR
jgi:hypothetical protein